MSGRALRVNLALALLVGVGVWGTGSGQLLPVGVGIVCGFVVATLTCDW